MMVLIHKPVLLLSMPAFLGVMRLFSPLLVSSSTTATGLTVAAIAVAVILLVSNVTIIYAQQELASQPSEIENGKAATGTVQSKNDSFRVQAPQGWVIHDVNNSGFTLGAEVLQGYGILAQLCQEEEQPQQQQGVAAIALPNAGGNTSDSSSSSNNNNSNSCRGAQEEVIHIIRYPNLGARLGLTSDDIIFNNNITTNAILAYQIQKLQEVGYRDIRIVNSTDTTINVDIGTGLNSNAIAASTTTVPAKLVEMTYSTNLAPTETRRGYLISTATDATPRNLGMITGYAIFYEGTITSGTITPATVEGGSSSKLPPRPVREVFDSFEIVAASEVAQAIVEVDEETVEEDEPADLLTVGILSNDTEGIAPATFAFEADITGGTEPYTINWDFNDDDDSEESDEQTISHTFDEDGTYNVTLTVTDSEDQTASDNIEITVEEPGEEEAAETDEEAV